VASHDTSRHTRATATTTRHPPRAVESILRGDTGHKRTVPDVVVAERLRVLNERADVGQQLLLEADL
jgi:hypothetical protein